MSMDPPHYSVPAVGLKVPIVVAPCQICGGTTCWHLMCSKCAESELGVVVRKSTVDGAGLGLFTLWVRQAGDPVAPYTGEPVQAADIPGRHSAYVLRHRMWQCKYE